MQVRCCLSRKCSSTACRYRARRRGDRMGHPMADNRTESGERNTESRRDIEIDIRRSLRDQVRKWWRERSGDVDRMMAELGVHSSYGLLAASGLLPLLAVPAEQLGPAILGVSAGVGTNLLANLIQRARDDSLAALDDTIGTDPERRIVDLIIDELRVLEAAREAFGDGWEAFAATLKAELEPYAAGSRTLMLIGQIEGSRDINVANMSGGYNVTAEHVTIYHHGPAGAHAALEGFSRVASQEGASVEGSREREAVTARAGAEQASVTSGALAKANPVDRRAWLGKMLGKKVLRDVERDFVTLEGVERIPVDAALIFLEGEGPSRTRKRERIGDLRNAFERRTRFVLLGDPGGGKSTMLLQYLYDALQSAMRSDAERVPILVDLAKHNKDPERDTLTPADFLQDQWERQGYARVIARSFEDVLRGDRLVVLLDGVNEIRREVRPEVIGEWAEWAADECPEDTPLVFACRTLDYVHGLDLPEVVVLPFERERIREYIERALDEPKAGSLWSRLEADEEACLKGGRSERSLFHLAGNPFVLGTLCMVFRDTGGLLPPNRGLLFHAFVMQMLTREAERQMVRTSLPKDQRECAQSYVEPLSAFAYSLQLRGEAQRIERDRAVASFPEGTDASDVLAFAIGAGLLEAVAEEEDEDDPDLRFRHHLLQESLAAGELLIRLAAGDDLSDFWRVGRTENELPEIPKPAPDQSPTELPSLPTTGWEETTIAAAGRASGHFPALIRAIRAVNAPLAARCLAESGADVDLPEDDARALRLQLLADLRDPVVDIRMRLESVLRLGRIGDPRFVETVGATGVRYIRPRLVPVSAGDYLVGNPPPGDPRHDEEAWPDEAGGERITLPAFAIGEYPVTNAEFRCFVKAGGYVEPEKWWTPDGRRWLDGTLDASMATYEANWRYVTGLDEAEIVLIERSRRSAEAASLRFIREMLLDEYLIAIREKLDGEQKGQPDYWNNPAYADWTVDNMPVIGISWYEAMAFCRWLDHQWRADSYEGADEVGENASITLPSEAEWESAGRGINGFRYPWEDDFDTDRANTVEGRIWRVNAVGAFPKGVASCGAHEMSGGVWEWTRSLWGTDPDTPDFGYPYRHNDGREEAEATADVLRIVRGGSWSSAARYARCAYRSGYGPDSRSNSLGFRVVLAPHTS